MLKCVNLSLLQYTHSLCVFASLCFPKSLCIDSEAFRKSALLLRFCVWTTATLSIFHCSHHTWTIIYLGGRRREGGGCIFITHPTYVRVAYAQQNSRPFFSFFFPFFLSHYHRYHDHSKLVSLFGFTSCLSFVQMPR